MIPIILSALLGKLAENGLGMIASAVQAKGKELIEDKLGVKLDDALQTQEGREQLLRLQYEHEEALQALAIERIEQELRRGAMGYADTASAREMNTRVNESANASWLAKNIAPVLALIVVAAGLYGLFTAQEPDVRTAVVGLITLVLGFYFGSTSSSKAKDTAIANLVQGGTR